MTDFEETLKPYIDPRWTFNMTVGISPGWQQLVLNTHANLVVVDPAYKITQIKEKFGGLRYYTSHHYSTERSAEEQDKWNQFQRIIVGAETESYKICEQCGTEDNVSTGILGEGYNWILTLCSGCRTTQLAIREARIAQYVGMTARKLSE